MTKQQIDDLLNDMDFTDQENEAFIRILEYAKDCQQINSSDNLKSFIDQQINNVVRNEN